MNQTEQDHLQQMLAACMAKVRANPGDFNTFKVIARIFWKLGKTDSAIGMYRQLETQTPLDPELPQLAKEFGVAPAVSTEPVTAISLVRTKKFEQLKRLFDLEPELFRHDRALIQELLRTADPAEHVDLVGDIVGEYLDEHLLDDAVQKALLQFETEHFKFFTPLCTRADTHFRPRDFKVSCIVSTYASAEFIETCLQDLVAQTIFLQMEIILIDACSPQNELELARPFLEKYDNIRYYRTPKRIGIYPAWTMGCLLASAPYVTPFSANDRLLPNAYEKLVRTLEQNPQATLVYGDSYLTDLPHQNIGTHSPSPAYNGSLLWPEITFGWIMVNCGVGPQPMWRASSHKTIGLFDRRYKATGDQDFFLRHARQNGLKHLEDFTGMAWITADSLSGKPSAHAETLNIQLKHFKATLDVIPAEAAAEIKPIFRERFNQIVTFLQQVGEVKLAQQIHSHHYPFLV